jgi:hypothetical protein
MQYRHLVMAIASIATLQVLAAAAPQQVFNTGVNVVLAFEPLPAEHDDKPHRIEIRTSRRPPPTIHARKTFVLGRDSGGVGSLTLQRPERMADSPSPAAPDPRGPTPATSAPAAPGSPDPADAPDAGAKDPGLSRGGPLPAPALRALLARASAYAERFGQAFSNVVAEERFVQVVKLWTGAAPVPGDEPELAWKAGTGEQLAERPLGPLRRRQLLSDVLLVQASAETWMGYRDVAEVNGKPVRDRGARVQKLFLSNRSEDRRLLQRIAEESARYNLGARRNINTPTFPLQILRPSFLGRFEFRRYRDDPGHSVCCTVVHFREVASPSIVSTWRGRDVALSGQLTVERATGRVTRASLQFSEQKEHVEGAFDVTYRRAEGFDLLIPDQLWEWYLTVDPDHPGRQAYVEGQASYTNVRRFTVSTEETLR